MTCRAETHPAHPPDPLLALFHAKPLFPRRTPLVRVHREFRIKAKHKARKGFRVLDLVVRIVSLFGLLRDGLDGDRP